MRDSSTEDPHRALIERYLAAYNSFDVAGMVATVHANMTFENLTGGEVTASASGSAEFRELAERAARLFSFRRQTIRSYSWDGEAATIDIHFDGILAADLGPTLRAGETLRLTGRSTFAFRDGLIARIVDAS